MPALNEVYRKFGETSQPHSSSKANLASRSPSNLAYQIFPSARCCFCPSQRWRIAAAQKKRRATYRKGQKAARGKEDGAVQEAGVRQMRRMSAVAQKAEVRAERGYSEADNCGGLSKKGRLEPALAVFREKTAYANWARLNRRHSARPRPV